MPVEARRRVGRDQIGQRAAALRRLLGSGRQREGEQAAASNDTTRACRDLSCSIIRFLTSRSAVGRRLLVEPDRRQILVDVMARADLPAFDDRSGTARSGATTSTRSRAPGCRARISRTRRISVAAALPDRSRAASSRRARRPSGPRNARSSRSRPSPAGTFCTSSSGLTMPWQGASTHDVEIAAAHRVEPRAGRHDLLRHLEPDLAPLVDQPGADIFVGLVDIAVEQLEAEALGAGFLQAAASPRRATSRCRANTRRSAAVPPWSPPAASRGRRCRRRSARWRSSTAPARRPSGRSPGSRRGAPGHRRTAFSCGLALPRCRNSRSLSCDGDLVAERVDQLVARRGRHAAELDRGAVAADRVDPGRLLVGEDRR